MLNFHLPRAILLLSNKILAVKVFPWWLALKVRAIIPFAAARMFGIFKPVALGSCFIGME